MTKQEREELIQALRGKNVVEENFTDEYMKSLDLAERQEVRVPSSEGEVPCYIFTAKNREPFCRVHINVHGGGFVRPHVLRDELYSAELADKIRGIVVDVDYKLAPEYPFPTAFNEVYDVCKWVFTQVEGWDGDPKRISIGGTSAGANLAAAAVLKANQTQEFALCLQVLNYGCFDLVTDPGDKPDAESNIIPIERARKFNRSYTDDNPESLKSPYMSPLIATDDMLEGLPATLITAAGQDNLRFEDLEYARRLALAGVTVTSRCFMKSNHGFITHCTAEWEEARAMIVEAIMHASL
ncbi:MAG: alpha/beta hydrolase fold domain-containing protein [Lachnospiraceae bacterium]|nr:alpha/beta hydrolase fold domain-containing protein [Lachnospiraceae bacterium]